MRYQPDPTHNPHFTRAYAAYHGRISRILCSINRILRSIKLLNSTKIQHSIRTTTMRSAFMHIAFRPFLPPPFANANKSMKLNQAACTCGGYDEAAGCALSVSFRSVSCPPASEEPLGASSHTAGASLDRIKVSCFGASHTQNTSTTTH